MMSPIAEFTAELYDRSGAPLLPTQRLQLSPRMFRSVAVGGPDIAEIAVLGAEENLAAIDDWLAYRVVIRNGAGNVVWFGYVHEVSRSDGALEIGYSLDAMANRVAADYTFEDANGATQSGRTAWLGDQASQDKFGVKEELLSFADSTAAQAAALVATTLAARAQPAPTLEISDQSDGGGVLRCRGWWHQLDWRFYANATGRWLKMADADIEHALGYVRVSNQIGFRDKNIHDLAARLNELPVQQQINISGAAQTANNGILSLDGKPPDTSATIYTATTISFDPLDDIMDSAEQLGVFAVGEMINVAGASNPANNATRFIKTLTDPPGRIEVSPATIVAEDAGATVTITRGHSARITGRSTFAREPAGANVTITPIGSRLAQSFQLPAAWTVRQAAIQARAFGAPPALRISMYSNAAGAPGTQLATTTIAAASVPRQMGWIQAEFSPGVALQENTTYWLVVEIDGGGVSDINYYHVGLDSTCADVDGSLLVFTGSAWSSRTPNADMPFQLWSLQDTATQIKNMLVASGVFTSVQLATASNVETRQYRAGDQRIRTEIERLLQVGDDDSTQLIVSLACDATGAPTATIQSMPAPDDDILLLPNGEIIDALAQRWDSGVLPAGRWVSITGTHTSRSITERLYVAEAEYDITAQRLRITPQFQSSTWSGTGNPPPQEIAQAVKPYLGGGGSRQATTDTPISADYLLADGSRQLVGNLSVAPNVTIDGVDISAHADNPAAHHAPAAAGDGISVSNQQISVNNTVVRTTRQILAGNGLTGGGSLAADVTLNVGVSGLGLSVAADTVNLTSSSNPGAAASILASDSSGQLSLVRLVASDRLRTPMIDTASGNLVLAPASNVISLPASVAIQTNNYASQLTGWRATYAGEADFRYLFVDEMHARAFIADLEQALAGAQIITKSVAMVAEAFTAPAAGGTATLRVRDLPSAPDMAVFQGGDIVRLRTFSRVNGSLSIEDAWGVVTNYIDQTDGTQTWTFTRSSAPNSGAMLAGTVIQPDSLVLDYGVAGNGFYEVNAIDGQYGQNSPYARIATWTGHPATGTALRAQFGNLRGVYGYPPDTSVFGVAMGDSTGANVTVDATNGVRLRNGTTDKIVLAPDGSSYFAGVMTIGTSGEIRQGTGTIGSNFTGLRIWRDGSIGRIAGYNNNVLQWYGGTDGYLYGGAGTAAINRYGYLISDVDISGGATWPFSYGGLHSVANVSTPTTNYRGSLMFGTPPGVYANAPRSWFVHYPGTLPASIPVGGGASLPLALMISDDSGNGPWAVWHAGNDGAASGLDADLLDGYHASAFALLSGAIFNGNVSPNTGGTRDLGTSGAPWRRIYVDEVIASTITGSTGLVGSIWQNDPGDMYIRSNSSNARTLYIANPGTGLMHLDVEGNITLGGTVDGVDVSAHAANANAHHAQVHSLDGTDHTGTLSWSKVSKTGSNLSDLAARAHSSLTGIGPDDHHARDHVLATNTGLGATHTISGATAGHVLRASGSTTAAFAAIQDGDLPSTIVRTSRQIIAGSGLTGGGDLSANRTLTLGTPSGLDASTTNAVTSTSHTHAISTAAATGLSATTTNAAGTSASLARADHTHAITSSSNPGAAASLLATNSSGYLQLVRLGLGMSPTRPLDVSGDAGVSGQIIAGSGAISGALTVGGDFTVGANVLYVNQAGTRVGINRAPDQQFDLDVAGAIRGQYLVGKHAIQLASAVGVWHFDGPQPYNLDFTGSNASHMGVGGTETGGVIYRPGKFGKAVQVAEATTNLVTNPSFETNVTGLANYNGLTAISRITTDSYIGASCAQCTCSAGAARRACIIVDGLVSGATYTVSAFMKTSSTVGNCFIVIKTRTNGNETRTLTAVFPQQQASSWTRIVATVTLESGENGLLPNFGLTTANEGDLFWIDGIQIEQKAYATPYCDGSLGSGHAWSGTAHASTSSRTAAQISYKQALSASAGTVMLWWRPDAYNSAANGNYVIWAGSNYTDFSILGNGFILIGGQSASVSAAPNTWVHIAITWQGTAAAIYKDGAQIATLTISPISLAATMTAGRTGYPSNGLIDEFVILDYAADPKLIRAIYESDAPVFVESSVFHWRSPSRVPIWVDEFGLWARGVSGNEILGLYGGDPRNPTGNVTRSWGGITMEENDVVIGRAAQAAVHWDDSAGTMLIGRPSAANMLLSGGALRIRNGTTDKIVLDSGGNASFSGAITAESGNIAGVLSIGSSGGIYQGSGTFASPTTGLKLWNDSGTGRIGGYNAGTLQWYAGTDGKLYAGGGNVAMSASGIAIAPNYDSTSVTFTNVGEFYALYSAGFGGTLCLRAGYNRPKESNLLLEAYSGTTVKSSLQLGANGIISAVGALGMTKTTAPSAPAPNGAYLYLDDNGSGKTRLMVRFGSGSAIQLAIQP